MMSIQKDARIYVAGHKGLVGSAIISLLHERGFEHILIKSKQELDLTNQLSVLDFFEKEKPEFVILAAAKVGGIMANAIYPADFIYENIAIAMNVIHASYLHSIKKLINLGSSCIYPKYAEQPIKEESLLTGLLEPTNEPYAIAKIAAIKLCTSYHRQYGSNFLSLMPTNLYGSKDNYHLQHSHVIPAIIRKCFLAKFLADGDFDALKKDLCIGVPSELSLSTQQDIIDYLASIGITHEALLLWGTGKAKREFLHATDLADAVLFALEHIDAQNSGDCINIGTGEDLEIQEIAHLIAELVGYTGRIAFDAEKPDGTPRKVMDISRAHGLGWHHAIDLRNGLSNIIEEYRLKGPEHAR
jgi:GDP-L-fucose synthase